METCERRVGRCEMDRSGNIIELERGFFRQGWVFKDWDAFYNKPEAPCYVPELSDAVYSSRDFIVLCNGREEMAERLFLELDWQSPSTVLDEWERDDEADV